MDNLTDFEPRRWFRKVQVEVEEAPGGLASLTSIEQEEEIDQLPILEGAVAPGWEVEDAVLCIGARTALDEAAGHMPQITTETSLDLIRRLVEGA